MRTPIIAAVFGIFALSAPLWAADVVEAGAEAADPVAEWQDDPTLRFEASEVNLQDFQWVARPIVVFADTAADPRFLEQIELLDERPDPLIARDVVIITDTNPAAGSEIRTKLRPRGFMMVLIGKDGGVKLRKPFAWDVRELSRSIDKMPDRQREIRAGG